MERMLKFRGFDCKCQKWVYGCGGIKFRSGGEFVAVSYCNMKKVKQWTLGEFTGFHDVNGKEIFEGDIIQNTNHKENIYAVEFDNGAFYAFGDGETYVYLLRDLLEIAPFEVVGNVHENKALILGSNQYGKGN